MFIGTIKDYILINQIDELLATIKKYVAQQHAGVDLPRDLDFQVHGRGHTTPSGPGELFVIGESLAPTQELGIQHCIKGGA